MALRKSRKSLDSCLRRNDEARVSRRPGGFGRAISNRDVCHQPEMCFQSSKQRAPFNPAIPSPAGGRSPRRGMRVVLLISAPSPNGVPPTAAQRRAAALPARPNDQNWLTPAWHSVICASHAGIAQLVERNLAKVEVASSSLVSRSSLFATIRLPTASSRRSGQSASHRTAGAGTSVRRGFVF